MDATTPQLSAFVPDRAHHDACLKRLRKMKERQSGERTSRLHLVLAKLEALARSARLEMIRGVVRWTADKDALNKIRANIEVEKTLGREAPQLWTEAVERQNVYRLDIASEEPEEKQFAKYHKESMEHWKHQINPMLAEEAHQSQLRSTGAIHLPGPKDESTSAELVQLANPRRRLRLLESRRDEDIVRTAEEVVQEIKALCIDEASDDEPAVPPVESAATAGV